jgi:hypothetical protein
MKRATMSFEEKREALLKAATSRGQGQGVCKQVPFPNNDVPEFLRQYRQFKEDSRKVRVVAR